MCMVEECIHSGSQYFQTWTLFQEHIRTAHPPTCSHPNCGKRFSSQKNLKAHLKIHEDEATQENLKNAIRDNSDDQDEMPSGKTSEVGRDWKCEWQGCTKSFKSAS
jgi:general transcription factor IIIA